MAETKPAPFIPDAELTIIKSAFFENPVLLKAVRNAILGLELDGTDKSLVASLSEPVKSVIRKRFFPTLTKDTVPGQALDLWTGIDLVGKSRDEVKQTIETRLKMIEMTKKGLARLDNPDGEAHFTEYDGVNDDLGINLTSRNRFIGHVEFQTRMLEVVAGQKNETEGQVEKRVAQNSSK